MKHLLDQPVWNALVSGNNGLSYGTDTCKFFDISVSPFADVREQHKDNFDALYEAVPADRNAAVFSVNGDLDTGRWSKAGRIWGYQMVYNGAANALVKDGLIIPLDEGNIEAMLALTALTAPGPFSERTIDFGHYHGIFQNERLAAMAGQRLHPGQFAEISGVCTHPDFGGKGFARKLILHQIERILAAGEIPFLHVKGENSNAIGLYKSIGFEVRSEIYIHLLKR